MFPKHSKAHDGPAAPLHPPPGPSPLSPSPSPGSSSGSRRRDESSHLALKNNLSGPFHDGATHGEGGRERELCGPTERCAAVHLNYAL